MYVYVHVYVCMFGRVVLPACHGTCLELRGHLEGVGSLLSPDGEKIKARQCGYRANLHTFPLVCSHEGLCRLLTYLLIS